MEMESDLRILIHDQFNGELIMLCHSCTTRCNCNNNETCCQLPTERSPASPALPSVSSLFESEWWHLRWVLEHRYNKELESLDGLRKSLEFIEKRIRKILEVK